MLYGVCEGKEVEGRNHLSGRVKFSLKKLWQQQAPEPFPCTDKYCACIGSCLFPRCGSWGTSTRVTSSDDTSTSTTRRLWPDSLTNGTSTCARWACSWRQGKSKGRQWIPRPLTR